MLQGGLINIGFGNSVIADMVICVVKSDSAPVKRLVEAAEKQNRLVDATSGRRTRSVIVTDSGHLILSHINIGTITSKLADHDTDDE